MRLNRRIALKTLVAGSWGGVLFSAADFWNRKPPSDWSAQEVTQLMSASPWAKEVNADFVTDTDPKLTAAPPSPGRGGSAPGPPQIEIGREPRDPSAGAKRRQPVVVRWESARPVREAGGTPLGADFKDRYVISVSGLPFGIMDRRREAAGNLQAGDRQRMIEQLAGAATLEAKGQAPEQPGVVQAAPRAPGTYLFGFSRELLPLEAGTREVVFTLETGLIALKAKFEPRAMIYRGSLAL